MTNKNYEKNFIKYPLYKYFTEYIIKKIIDNYKTFLIMDDTQIDLTNIDWNELNFEEFQSLEQKISEHNKTIAQKNRKKKTLNVSNKIVILKGNKYSISEGLYNRLIKLKSSKSKEKLIEEIICNNNPLQVEEI